MKSHRLNVFSALMIALCASCLFVSSASAQISSGGTPLSQSIAVPTAPTVAMPRINVQDYLDEDATESKDVPFRFGAPFEVAYDLNSSGTWTELPDGGRIWRLRISSPGAYSLNLVYDDFFLPTGAKLFLYNDNYEYVIGAFTSANNKDHGQFGTQPVPGDATTLEYYEPAKERGNGHISIMRVVHAYRNLFGYASGNLDSYGDSGSCNNNVACDTEWDNQERGVVMLTTSGGSRYCSGSLINNTANDGRPFVLTANHCSPGNTDVCMFNYQSPTCTNQDGPTNQTVSGTTVRFSSSASDVWLMELSSSVPLSYNPYYSGWNANDVAPTEMVGIHHPRGDIKKISWDYDPGTSTSYLGSTVPGDGSHWRVLDWDDGTTEPGSSGSPLYDQNYRIIGQLHGGYAACGNDDADWYGKVSMSMTNGMDSWLGTAPGNVLDGFDPNIAGSVVGTVRDAGTLAPLDAATVAVTPGGVPQTQSNASGAYDLPLADGTWDLEYSKFGYFSQTITNIVITEGAEVTQNVNLTAAPTGTLSGTVTSCSGGPAIGATVELIGMPISPETTDGTGFYSFTIPQGTYDVSASGAGCGEQIVNGVVVTAATTQNFTLPSDPAFECSAPDGGGYIACENGDGGGPSTAGLRFRRTRQAPARIRESPATIQV